MQNDSRSRALNFTIKFLLRSANDPFQQLLQLSGVLFPLSEAPLKAFLQNREVDPEFQKAFSRVLLFWRDYFREAFGHDLGVKWDCELLCRLAELVRSRNPSRISRLLCAVVKARGRRGELGRWGSLGKSLSRLLKKVVFPCDKNCKIIKKNQAFIFFLIYFNLALR